MLEQRERNGRVRRNFSSDPANVGVRVAEEARLRRAAGHGCEPACSDQITHRAADQQRCRRLEIAFLQRRDRSVDVLADEEEAHEPDDAFLAEPLELGQDPALEPISVEREHHHL